MVHKAKKREQKEEKIYAAKPKDTRLYFQYNIPGVGEITCKSCGYNQKLTGSWHSNTKDEIYGTGYQCQGCGKFHELRNESNDVKIGACECGGDLERTKPLFCPECKSFELSYRMSYIT